MMETKRNGRGAFELRFEKDEDVRERGLPKKK
jgi:hypothetical protein